MTATREEERRLPAGRNAACQAAPHGCAHLANALVELETTPRDPEELRIAPQPRQAAERRQI